MSALFQPLQLRSIQLKNRIAVSPMCQYSATDGFANDWHMVHLGSRAVGGAALVIAEATAVAPEGRITYGDLGIWSDAHIDPLKRISTFISQHNAVPGIQLAHAGRKASCHVPWKGGKVLSKEEGAWQTLAPSAIPFHEDDPVPKEMTTADIHHVVQQFAAAAERAMAAGFKLIEIHGAHGYLINSFLSPATNKRTDSYGGNFENRTRILTEVIVAIREVWPRDLPLFLRISASDYVDNGWSVNDSVELAKLVKPLGVDLIDCSSGGNVHGARIPVGPMYQTPFAAQVKAEANIKTGAVGLITTAHEAENIIKENKADIVLLARQFLRDPYFPLHAAHELNVDVPWPDQYLRAKLK